MAFSDLAPEPSDSGRIRLFIVDDHELIRLGIRARLDGEPDLETVGEAGRVRGTDAALLRTRPDVVLVDVTLSDGDGLELIGSVRNDLPRTRFIVLSGSDDEVTLHRSIVAGASAFVLKGEDLEGLLEVIRSVARGEHLVESMLQRYTRHRTARSRDENGRLASLTPQERTVLSLIGEGLTNREISQRLFVSEKTVRNHVSHVLGKLGLRHRTEAALFVASSVGV